MQRCNPDNRKSTRINNKRVENQLHLWPVKCGLCSTTWGVIAFWRGTFFPLTAVKTSRFDSNLLSPSIIIFICMLTFPPPVVHSINLINLNLTKKINQSFTLHYLNYTTEIITNFTSNQQKQEVLFTIMGMAKILSGHIPYPKEKPFLPGYTLKSLHIPIWKNKITEILKSYIPLWRNILWRPNLGGY